MTRPRLRFAFALLATLALPAGTARAQPVSLAVTVGLDRATIDAEPFVRFAETYNALYDGRALRPFEPISDSYTRPVVGVVGRVDTGGFSAGFGYQFAPRRTQTRSTDLDGIEQEMAVSIVDHAASVEMLVPIGPLAVGASFGAVYRHDRVTVDLVYPDGSRSMGAESFLNGVYTADASYLEVGPVAAIRAGRLLVPVRVLFPVQIGGGEGLPLTDDDVFELNAAFPSDVGQYESGVPRTGSEADVTDRDLTGLRVQVGVEFSLF